MNKKFFENYDKIYNLPDSKILFPPFIYRKIVKCLKGDILDIGGADGRKMLNLLKSANYSIISSIDIIEPSPLYNNAKENFKFKKLKKVKIYNKALENINKHKKYDVILCFEVLEHLEDPNKSLKIIKKLLKPKGILIISTPNKYVYHFLSLLKKERIDPTHISEMTYLQFKKLISKYFKRKIFYGFFPIMFIIRKFPKLDFINKIYKELKFLSRTIYCFASDDIHFKV